MGRAFLPSSALPSWTGKLSGWKDDDDHGISLFRRSRFCQDGEDAMTRKEKVTRLVNMVFKAAKLADELDVHLGNGAEVGSLLGGIYEDIKNLELER